MLSLEHLCLFFVITGHLGNFSLCFVCVFVSFCFVLLLGSLISESRK